MEIFDFAIQMEKDGENYYREQAQKNAGNKLNNVFLMLANDEKRHGEILKSKSSGARYDLEDSQTLARSKSVFKGIGDFKSEIKPVPSQMDLYIMALDMEKKSIDLYQDFLSKADDDSSREIFSYLVGQENEHYAIIQDLVEMLNNAISWVESAEFGNRKEY